MDDRAMLTADAKLIDALLRSGRAETAGTIAGLAGVDLAYAEEALARMADWPLADRGQPGERLIDDEDPTGYPIMRRVDLGPDVYEAIEDSTRRDAT